MDHGQSELGFARRSQQTTFVLSGRSCARISARDVFPDPNDENRAYFLDNSSYSANIQVLHERAENRLRYLFSFVMESRLDFQW